MNTDPNTKTKQGVFTIHCPDCNVSSFVGFECSEDTFADYAYGLIAYARHLEGVIDPITTPQWMHCPACDKSLTETEYPLENIITDITKPQL